MILGITGGVGAGKSLVLQYLKEEYRAVLLEMDAIGKEVMEPDGACFAEVASLFGSSCVKPDGTLDRAAIAKIVFNDPKMRGKLNAVIHPAVLKESEERIRAAQSEGRWLIVIESAILVEAGAGKLCDRIWYIDAAEEVRRTRLRASRGYSDERIDDMLRTQRKPEWYRQHADDVIENNGDFLVTKRQIDSILAAYGCG